MGGETVVDRSCAGYVLRIIAAVVAVAVCCGAMVAGVARGAVPRVFGAHGEGAGQFMGEAFGVAVNQVSGDVYVVDSRDARVDEFSGEGVFVRAWGWGVVSKADELLQECTEATGCVAGNGGSGAGQFGRPEGVAVDNSVGSSHGDVYVVDSSNARVEKFNAEGGFILMFGGEVNATKDASGTATATEKDVCTQEEIEFAKTQCVEGVGGEGNGQFAGAKNAVGVNAEGRVYVGDASGRVQRFNEDGEYEATVLSGVGVVEGLAVASDGDLYVLSGGRVQEYEPNGTKIGPVLDATGTPRAVAANDEGGVFVDDQNFERGGEHHIFEYDAAGTQTESFDKAPFTEDAKHGLAFGEKLKTLYLLNHFTENGARVIVDDVRTVGSPPPGALVVPPVSVSAGPRGKAVVEATVNPENAETEYFVKYGTSAPLTTTSAMKTLAASFEESEVTVELSGLAFSTEYRYCIVARNANGETRCVENVFRSAPATRIDAEWVEDVTGSSVTFAAEVNPEETATRCAFEYGAAAFYASTGSFEHVVAASAIAAPEDAAMVVSAHAREGVAPGVEYVYRLACEKEAVKDEGGVQSFRGESGHAGIALPDARVLEVAAANVNGAALMAPDYGGLPQAAEAGDAIAYLRHAANTAGAAGSRAPEPTVDIARHQQAGGWFSVDITTPYGTAAPLVEGNGTEYLLFSGDLSAAVVAPRDAAPLAASASERTPYRRTETGDQTPLFEPLLTRADVAEGVKFGEEGVVEVLGANATLSHVVLGSLVALTAGSVPDSLYEWSAGRLVPVSVLPAAEGGAIVEGELGSGPHSGAHRGNVRGAVSEDGSLVYWKHGAGLYVRDTSTGESLRLDVPQEGVVPQNGEAEGAEFQIASVGGSRVFFTSTRRLTPGARASGEAPDLYECVVTAPPAGALSCALSDVTEKVLNGGERANVQGLVAAADATGSEVFFVAKGVLAAGATAGEYNLYTAAFAGGAWQSAWIATLTGVDAQDWAQSGELEGVHQLTEASSPDGHFFAFMSSRSLTGYDNRDLVSGAADEEVYLYDTQTRRLACVSCDPTGGRPRGVLDVARQRFAATSPVDIEGIWRNHWVAGLLAAWQSLSITGEGVTAYQPRSLSDGGRLFFDSASALTSQAVNGTVGVYEFEPVGVGSCTSGAAGFSPVDGGCVGLVSAGTAAGDSVFMDASANGNDVFVMSRVAGSVMEGGLAPYVILDAHSCEAGSSWACASPSAVASSVCESRFGCAAPVPGVAARGGLPGSSVFSGAGNLVRRVVKAKKRGACRARAGRIRDHRRRRRALARCAAGGAHGGRGVRGRARR
jgi:hypothetical protein